MGIDENHFSNKGFSYLKSGQTPCCRVVLFPNRSLLLGFSWGSKRGLPENTHKACSGHCRQPARVYQGPLKIRRVLPSKSKFTSSFWQTEKFATVKIRVWRFWTHFPIVLKWPSKKMFCWLIFVHVFTFIFRCSSKKLFCWLIFVHVFTLTISLKGALFTCTYESNQSIEWTNRINEWKQWIEALNRTNESNQWIESLSRETRQEAVTIHIRWLSKPGLESHYIECCYVTII